MLNIPKAEQRYSETELDLQRKLEYDRGYADGRASIVEEFEKIKTEIQILSFFSKSYNTQMVEMSNVVERIDNHIKELKGEKNE